MSKLKPPTPEQIAEAVDRTLESLFDDLYEEHLFQVEAGFDNEERVLHIEVKAVHEPEIQEPHLGVFYDVFYELEMNVEDVLFEFDWLSFQDQQFTQKLHHYHLRSLVEAMPETGGVSAEEWEQYVEQLEYTIDGREAELEPPEFIEEEELE